MKAPRPFAFLVSGLLLAPLSFGRAATQVPAHPVNPEAQVKSLVKQLGDRSFARREAAHKALLKLGDEVVPLLERLDVREDPEVQLRLRSIRRTLVGYQDDLRTGLAALPDLKNKIRFPLPEGLKQVVAAHQPKSGNYLLTLITDPKGALRHRAVNAFVNTWDSMSASQIKAYLRLVLTPKVQARSHYPRGVDAMVRMLYYLPDDYGAWPEGDRFAFTTRTTHFLDGKPYGKPFAYRGPIATTGWIRTKDLPLGKHTCALEVSYEFTHRGARHAGRLRSPEVAFTMLPADSPDALIAPKDAATDRLVRGSLRLFEKESALYPHAPRMHFGPPEDERRPHVFWQGPSGKSCGLAALYCKVDQALPVDLCFEVTVQDLKTGKVYPCDPLVLPRGVTRYDYVCPRDVQAFARGRTGDVPVKVTLTPSRKMALCSLEVARYWPGAITSGVLAIRIYDNYVEPTRGGRK